MYSCSAPAAARPIEADTNIADTEPETASAPKARNDLKLVGPPEAPQEYAAAPQPHGQEALAARILRMHAASDTAEHQESILRAARPDMVDVAEAQGAAEPRVSFGGDPVSNAPDLLRRPAGIDDTPAVPDATLETWPLPRRARSAAKRNIGNGPSFRTLVASTIAIVAIGGVALSFGLKGFLERDQASRNQVGTESIQAEPTIESLIAAETGTGALSAAVTADGEPSSVQIASAKDEIRKVLSGRTAVPLQPSEDMSGDAQPERIATDKSQARLVQAATSGVSLNRSATSTVSARRQATVRVDRIVEPKTTDIAGSRDPAAGQAGSTAGAPAPAPSAAVSVADASAFPNSGRTVAAVNMRQSGDSDSAVVAVIPSNAEVRYSSCGDWWCNVAYEGKSGYIGAKFLSQTAKN